MADTKKKSNAKKQIAVEVRLVETKPVEVRLRKQEGKTRWLRNCKIIVTEDLFVDILAVALFLFLSNFGICGIVGNTLRDAMLGCFGWMDMFFLYFWQ